MEGTRRASPPLAHAGGRRHPPHGYSHPKPPAYQASEGSHAPSTPAFCRFKPNSERIPSEWTATSASRCIGLHRAGTTKKPAGTTIGTAGPRSILRKLAEGEGFEPPGLAPRRFQDAHIKPL
jgi:hypothetical protein